MKDNKTEIITFLKRGEKTASEISINTKTNYYKVKELLDNLLKEGKIQLINFRNKKYYKLK